MVKCPFCQISYVDNTIFCTECGYYLLDDEKRETDKLERDEAVWLGDMSKPSTDFTEALNTRPPTLRLKIGPQKREVELLLDRVILVGRVDPTMNIYPEIDVTEDISPSKSVSRRHARILKDGNNVIVEDLGSVNGTFINSKKLDPYLPETLTHDDILQVGTLLIKVEILK